MNFGIAGLRGGVSSGTNHPADGKTDAWRAVNVNILLVQDLLYIHAYIYDKSLQLCLTLQCYGLVACWT